MLQDVGRILKLECTPVSQNGLYMGKAVSVESGEVMQVSLVAQGFSK
jgi:hypothetical protein